VAENRDNSDNSSSLWGPLERVRSGPGVVGRTSYVALALILLSFGALYAFRDRPELVLTVFLIDVVVAVAYVAAAFWYANKFPHFATMEGAEVVRYTELQQAAKEPGLVIDGSAEPVANTSPPAAIAYRSGNDA
jgi:hypothetical protein